MMYEIITSMPWLNPIFLILTMIGMIATMFTSCGCDSDWDISHNLEHVLCGIFTLIMFILSIVTGLILL